MLKRLWILVFISFGFLINANAQNTVAKIKYEEAEEAYNNGNFRETLVSLDEVQKILGSLNPRILYLRIMAQKSLFEKGGQEFGLLDSLRKNTAFYLKEYGSNTAVEDKYREIYAVSKQLTKYPLNKEEFDKLDQDQKAAVNRLNADKEAKRKLATRSNQFIDSLVKLYKFLPGGTLEDFKLLNPLAASTLTKAITEDMYGRAYSEKHIVRDLKDRLGPYSFSKLRYENVDRVTTYAVTVELIGKNEKEKVLKNWMDLFQKNIPSDFYYKEGTTNTTLVVAESEYIRVGVILMVLDNSVLLSFSYFGFVQK